MNHRAAELMHKRSIKTQAVVGLLGKAASLYHEITAATKELAEIARDSNPDKRILVRETLVTIGADRLSLCIESSLRSLMAHEPPIDILAECEKGNRSLSLTIGKGSGRE